MPRRGQTSYIGGHQDRTPELTPALIAMVVHGDYSVQTSSMSIVDFMVGRNLLVQLPKALQLSLMLFIVNSKTIEQERALGLLEDRVQPS